MQNRTNSTKEIMQNKTIMDYVTKFLSDDKDKAKKLHQINSVRLHKRTYLPLELVDVDSFQNTNAF